MQRWCYGILASEVIEAITISRKRLPQWKAQFSPDHVIGRFRKYRRARTDRMAGNETRDELIALPFGRYRHSYLPW